ncbi:hypothetical protein Ahia01_001237300 [Argonauta hians]
MLPLLGPYEAHLAGKVLVDMSNTDPGSRRSQRSRGHAARSERGSMLESGSGPVSGSGSRLSNGSWSEASNLESVSRFDGVTKGSWGHRSERSNLESGSRFDGVTKGSCDHRSGGSWQGSKLGSASGSGSRLNKVTGDLVTGQRSERGGEGGRESERSPGQGQLLPRSLRFQGQGSVWESSGGKRPEEEDEGVEEARWELGSTNQGRQGAEVAVGLAAATSTVGRVGRGWHKDQCLHERLAWESNAEVLARRFPHAHVVKGLNTLTPQVLAVGAPGAGGFDEGGGTPMTMGRAVPLAGADPESVRAVRRVVRRMGFNPVCLLSDPQSATKGGSGAGLEAARGIEALPHTLLRGWGTPLRIVAAVLLFWFVVIFTDEVLKWRATLNLSLTLTPTLTSGHTSRRLTLEPRTERRVCLSADPGPRWVDQPALNWRNADLARVEVLSESLGPCGPFSGPCPRGGLVLAILGVFGSAVVLPGEVLRGLRFALRRAFGEGRPLCASRRQTA